MPELPDYRTFRIPDPITNTVVLGGHASDYGLSLDDVESWLDERAFGAMALEAWDAAAERAGLMASWSRGSSSSVYLVLLLRRPDEGAGD